jgi:F-type H+-transporting ATPase subunit delta
MAVEELAAKRYGQAVFEIAAENGDFEAWSASLRRIAAFTGQRDQAQVLENSRVPRETKHRLIDAGLNDLPQAALGFAQLLVDKGRTGLAGQVAEYYETLVEDRRGIEHAVVTTAVPLGDAERDSIGLRLRQMTGAQVQIETRVDPAILGGVIIQIGDRLFDGSTRSRLRSLKESLVGAMG